MKTPGAGKNTLQEIITQIVGFNNMLIETGRTGIENAAGKFNESSFCKIVSWYDELSYLDKELLQRLKALATNPTATYNPKHRTPFTSNNVTRIFFAANQFVTDLDEGDRRFLLAMCKVSPKLNFELINELILKRGGWKAIQWYLYTLRANSRFKTKGQEPCASTLKTNLLHRGRS